MSAGADRVGLHLTNAWTVLTNRRQERERVMRRYAFDAARQVTPAIVAQAGPHRYLVDTADKSLGRATFSDGEYELDVMRQAMGIVEQELGRSPLHGALFLDVGANIGTTTVPAVLEFGASRAVAIEPSPGNYTHLRCNVILNGIDKLVTCVQAAVSLEEGTVDLELSNTNFGDHRVRVTGADGDFGEGRRDIVSVPAQTLDGILAELDISVDETGLIWVDTQGYEGHVLSSAPELRAAERPWVIEYWPYGLDRAGGQKMLEEAIVESFSTIVDVRTGHRLSAASVADLREQYTGHLYTDLVLIP